MTVKGGTSQACAACKYQRRKCSDKCPLAPYFPADDPDRFENAHRLYGVSNMMKILKQVSDDQKRAAMDTIIFESRMRRRDPVHGCYGIVRDLCEQLERHTHVLYRLNAKIQEQQFRFHRKQFPSQPLYCSSSSRLQQQSSQPLYASSSSSSGSLQPPPPMVMESYNNIPVHSYLQHHHQRQHRYHPPFVGTSVVPSNQLLINETKGSHVQIDKKISNSLCGRADVHNINGNSQI